MVPPRLQTGSHAAVFSGLWHTRQIEAWKRAWSNHLIESVQSHGGGMYTVPSQTEPDKWYAVWRYTLAPDGYIWVCDCAASERGGVVCSHVFACYLWRLRHRLRWRLIRPQGGADARGKTSPTKGVSPGRAVAEREARPEAGAEAV